MMTRAPKRKYKNTPTTYDGHSYGSKAEARFAMDLDQSKRAGLIRGWTRQVPFRLGVEENIYRCDFVVWNLDGSSYAVDVKGLPTPKFNRDCRLWARYAPIELRVVTKGKVIEIIVPECMEAEAAR